MYEVLLSNKFCSLKFKGDNTFFEYCICDSERTIDFSYPVLEIEGKTEQIRINHWRKPVLIEKNRNGMNEYLLKGISSNSGILMNLYIHILDESPVIRFRYELFSELTCWLTKNSAKDNNTYFGVGLTGFENFKEVSLSEFEALPYSSLAADSETVQSSFESSNLHLDDRERVLTFELIGCIRTGWLCAWAGKKVPSNKLISNSIFFMSNLIY